MHIMQGCQATEIQKKEAGVKEDKGVDIQALLKKLEDEEKKES